MDHPSGIVDTINGNCRYDDVTPSHELMPKRRAKVSTNKLRFFSAFDCGPGGISRAAIYVLPSHISKKERK